MAARLAARVCSSRQGVQLAASTAQCTTIPSGRLLLHGSAVAGNRAAHDPPPITCKTHVDSFLKSSSSLSPPQRQNSSSSTASPTSATPKPRPAADETSIAGAQHKPSMGGASLAHLVSELSATTPQMVREGRRVQGETTDEASRDTIRRTATWLMAFPVAVGTNWVGWEWYNGNMNAAGGSKASVQDD